MEIAVDVPEAEESRDSRKMDPEILCLSRIARMIEELDTEAKARVIGYLSRRYNPEGQP